MKRQQQAFEDTGGQQTVWRVAGSKASIIAGGRFRETNQDRTLIEQGWI
jgi:hypothetical protein